MDKTEYARSIGYTGRKKVCVIDGKVVSHRRMDWFEFCDQQRRKARDKLRSGQQGESNASTSAGI